MPFEGIPTFDAAVMEFVQTHLHNAATDAIFPILTHLGETGAVWVALALVFLCFKRTRTTGILMLVSLLLTFLTGELLLKNIVCRPRPCSAFPQVPLLIEPPGSYSFPSGHSSSSFAAATILFLRHKKSGCAAFAAAALIAFSRVFLFVHYLTDILAGTLLGVLCALFVHFVYRKRFAPALSKPSGG